MFLDSFSEGGVYLTRALAILAAAIAIAVVVSFL